MAVLQGKGTEYKIFKCASFSLLLQANSSLPGFHYFIHKPHSQTYDLYGHYNGHGNEHYYNYSLGHNYNLSS